jgi:2',3'-cyclic-nucleotide 2'-phosphodiesterase (5'-nucleotidase family)
VYFVAIIARAAAPDAIVIAVGDVHSAYDRAATLVALVDRVRGENPNVPLAILLDGDCFEYGNRVARHTTGKLDLEMLRALARRAPTVLNIGNHETDLFSMSDLIERVRAAGVTVISGNARSRETGKPFASATAKLMFGAHSVAIVGFTTDALATYRFAIRPALDLDNPIIWAKAHVGEELAGADIAIVMSHAGLRADREILPLAPPGTLYVGGHDHLRFIRATTAYTYVHTGSWLQSATVARLSLSGKAPHWQAEQVSLVATEAADAELASLIHSTVASALSDDDRRVVGHNREAMNATAAARFAVESARRAAKADLAILGATTFGDGLPAGNVTAYALDNCVRFDGPLYVATITGETARALLRRSNQGPETPFEERTGENLIACAGGEFDDAKTYRVVTTDWIGRNPTGLLGKNAPQFSELKGVTLKAAVVDALKR